MSSVGLDSLLHKSEFVLIERGDLLGQAISWSIASQTGAWIGGQEERRQPAYQRDHIDKHMQMIVEQNRKWKLLLASIGKTPLILSYELFAKHPATGTQLILEHMGIEAANIVVAESTKVQRGPRNDRWRRIYLRKKTTNAPDLT
jgi:LPS sulfotransferase NodH